MLLPYLNQSRIQNVVKVTEHLAIDSGENA